MTLVQDFSESEHLEETQQGPGSLFIPAVSSYDSPDDHVFNKFSLISTQSDETIAPDGQLLLFGRLERQGSCGSFGSLESCEDSHSSADEDVHSEDGREDNMKINSQERCERSSSVESDASEEGCRDSGIEAEKEPDMIVPDSSLIEKIVFQVESYFSDACVVKDKFLLKHIRRNKEGYVSLKLVSSFKKVKQLTKDWRVVAFSLEKASTLIQINEQRTKIRRVTPLPEVDDSPVTCAVLALDLPLDKPSVESVSKLFGSLGEISLVRVLRAGGPLPSDVKSLLTKYPTLGNRNCAWLEFETPEAAKAATRMSEEDGMKVVLVVPESQKKQQKQSRKDSGNKHGRTNNYNRNANTKTSYNSNYSFSKPRKDYFGCDRHEMVYRRPMVRRKAVSLPSSQNPYLNSLRSEGNKNLRPKSKSCVEFSPSVSPPPSWVQRHLFAAAAASAASAAAPTGSRTSSNRIPRVSMGSLPLSEGVLRLPKGPDGTRGFFMRAERIRSIASRS